MVQSFNLFISSSVKNDNGSGQWEGYDGSHPSSQHLEGRGRGLFSSSREPGLHSSSGIAPPTPSQMGKNKAEDLAWLVEGFPGMCKALRSVSGAS